MSYDMCCRRWGSGCSSKFDHTDAHFCSAMVGQKGGSHSGSCVCNCGARLAALTSPSSPRRTLALAAMMAASVVPGGEGPRRQSFTERHGLDRQWDGSEKAQADKIARAKAKRERKNARRLSGGQS